MTEKKSGDRTEQEYKRRIASMLVCVNGCLEGASSLMDGLCDQTQGELQDGLQDIWANIQEIQGRISLVALSVGSCEEQGDQTGDTLTEYINRNRPPAAPMMHGEAVYSQEQGFRWENEDWDVSCSKNSDGDMVICWSTITDSSILGYMLKENGSRTHTVNDSTAANGLRVLPGWPEEAAA